MVSASAHRVANRFRTRTGTLVYRDPERDLYWGWFTRDVPARMHLTLISPSPYDCIVWLEDRGTRTISSVGCPRELTRRLFPWIWENRDEVEQKWLRFMEAKGWLSVRAEWDRLQLVCYEGQATEFTRPINAAVWVDER
jgi:hypothetical protein